MRGPLPWWVEDALLLLFVVAVLATMLWLTT